MTTQTARPLRPLRRMIPLVCLTGLLLPALAGAQAPAATSGPSQLDAVDALVQKSMQVRQFPAASIAVIKDGRVIVAKGYGLSNVEKSIKATEQTVYQLASVTKPFTAMATLMLVEAGKLSLDAKVTDILPGLPAAWSPVTVRHLLTHTSGIRSYTDTFGEKKVTNGQVFTHGQILALVKDAPLQFAPGDRFAYSNTGYFLLGMIIEKVSGRSYGTFLAGRIFKPLGMTSTSLDDYADARPVRARGYNTVNGQTTVAEHTHPSQPFAAGALVSNVLDMAKWDAALSARKLLKPASYDAMWTPMRFNDGKTSAYAFGWQVDPFRGHPRQAHGGGITGFSTFVARLPEDKLTVIVLTNQTGAAGQSLADALVELLVPALRPKTTGPAADADPKTTAFLRNVLVHAARGEANPEWLTPAFQTFLLPDRIKQGPQMMGQYGELTAFDLIEETVKDGARVRIYRATFGTTPLRAQFTLAPDGKIAGLGISADH